MKSQIKPYDLIQITDGENLETGVIRLEQLNNIVGIDKLLLQKISHRLDAIEVWINQHDNPKKQTQKTVKK